LPPLSPSLWKLNWSCIALRLRKERRGAVKGKSVVIVDDVLSTGGTVKETINDVRKAGGSPLLVVVIVNKSSRNEIDGVPLRGIIRARSVGGTILGGGPLHSFPYG